MKKKFRSRGPELLLDLADQVSHALMELGGLVKEESDQLGREIAERMAAHWGGQNLYFPMGLSMQLSDRDRQIFAEFTGSNQSELAMKYKMSVQWVYRIVKLIRAEELARRQGDLFDEDDEDGED